MMNGYEKREMEDDTFGPKGSIVSAFDAFRKHRPLPTSRSMSPTMR